MLKVTKLTNKKRNKDNILLKPKKTFKNIPGEFTGKYGHVKPNSRACTGAKHPISGHLRAPNTQSPGISGRQSPNLRAPDTQLMGIYGHVRASKPNSDRKDAKIYAQSTEKITVNGKW